MLSRYVKVENETQWILLQELAFAYGKRWGSCDRKIRPYEPNRYLVIYKRDEDLCHSNNPHGTVLSIPEWVDALKRWPDTITLTINGQEVELSDETIQRIKSAIE